MPGLSTESVLRIRASFELVAPRATELIDTFYADLFAGHPQVRGIFPTDMTDQKKHLLAAVALVVKHADNLGAIETPLMEMGKRHEKYGAKPEHYGVVRDTMLGALGKVAGPAWNPTLKTDWESALNAVAGVMLKGV